MQMISDPGQTQPFTWSILTHLSNACMLTTCPTRGNNFGEIKLYFQDKNFRVIEEKTGQYEHTCVNDVSEKRKHTRKKFSTSRAGHI